MNEKGGSGSTQKKSCLPRPVARLPCSRSSSTPHPHNQFCQDPPTPFGRGDSRTWDLLWVLLGISFTFSTGFWFYIHFLHSEDAKFGISVYFCMILLISDTIFSGRVQSRTGFFNQLYRAPFGSNFSEFFMIRKVLLVVDDFLDN